jgi:hypothetical protein
MTGLALNSFSHMLLVGKVNKVRHVVNPHPFDRLSGFILLPHLDNVGLAGGDCYVTAHADIHCRHGGKRGALGIGVTVETGNLIVSGMNLMAERQWLHRGIAQVVVSLSRELPQSIYD